MKAFLRKELITAVRRPEGLTLPLFYGIGVAFLFGFAFELSPRTGYGALFVSLSLVAVIYASRSYAEERELDGLGGVLASPLPRAVVYLAKSLTAAVYLLLVGLLLWLLTSLFFHVSYGLHPGYFVVAALVVIGISQGATLLSALSAGASNAGALASVLFLPLAVPHLVAGTEGFAAVGAGENWLRWAALSFTLNAAVATVALLFYERVGVE